MQPSALIGDRSSIAVMSQSREGTVRAYTSAGADHPFGQHGREIAAARASRITKPTLVLLNRLPPPLN